MNIKEAVAKLDVDQPVYYQHEGFDYEHRLDISLPMSYHLDSEREYPVIWVMDGNINFSLAAGISKYYPMEMIPGQQAMPEVIVVGVGYHLKDMWKARMIDYTPPGGMVSELNDEETSASWDMYLDMCEMTKEEKETGSFAKADCFFDYLVNSLRPALKKKFRMADDHAIYGHSSSSVFTAYALFKDPKAFNRVVISCEVNQTILDMEKEYAKTHDDLEANVYFSVAEHELDWELAAGLGVCTKTLILAQRLLLRKYTSLKYTLKQFPNKDHITVIPVSMSEGFEAIFKE